jgi:2'-5' RNA ligase
VAASARLFIGLWPSPAALAAVLAQRAYWTWPPGVRLVAPDKLHLTLHFLGDVATARLPELIAAVDGPAPAFTLRLDAAEVWRQGVAVLVPGTPPAALGDLHERLGATLQRLALPVEARRFRPHLTLAREARGATPPASPEPIDWPASAVRLVQSVGGRYEALAQWPLAR